MSIFSSNTRKVELVLMYENKEIAINEFIINFTYTDRTSNDAMDDMSVTLQDVDGLWSGAWYPQIGAKFNAIIKASNWFETGDYYERDCGGFEIDDLTINFPPSEVTISCKSIGVKNAICRQQNTQSRENIDLKTIAGEICEKHGFELQFESDFNPTLERWEQVQESDISALKTLCVDYALMIKVTNSKIIIFSSEEFDSKEPEIIINKRSDAVLSGSFNINSSDIYTACEVRYYDSEKKQLWEYHYKPEVELGRSDPRMVQDDSEPEEKPEAEKPVTYVDENTREVVTTGGGGGGSGKIIMVNEDTREAIEIDKPKPEKVEEEKPVEIADPSVGQVLKINKRVSNIDEAMNLAKAYLRNANMRQIKGTLNFMGRPDLYSGLTLQLVGFGVVDSAIWYIESTQHNYSRSGYTTTIEVRGVLGY